MMKITTEVWQVCVKQCLHIQQPQQGVSSTVYILVLLRAKRTHQLVNRKGGCVLGSLRRWSVTNTTSDGREIDT